MAIRDTGTEQLIKDTAERIFFAEGKFNATTLDIAKEAGVARTVINYYFRSKDTLIKQVFKETMGEFARKMDEVLLSELPLKKKVTRFIDVFSTEIMQYPYKEVFLISEINSFGFEVPERRSPKVVQNFLKEIQQAMDKGEVKKMLPINFLLNLFSLICYPVVTKPLFKELLEISNIKFDQLLQERKKMIIDILFI